MYSFDKDDIKNSLTIEQVSEILSELGGEPRLSGDVIYSSTICHNHPGEGSHKLYYYDNTKLFKCYTGCGDYFDIFDLVLRSKTLTDGKDWTLYRSIAYVANRFGFVAIEQEEVSDLWHVLDNYDRIKEIRIDGQKTVELKEYDSSILDRLSYPIIEPWEKEGIVREVIKANRIGYYPKEAQITIPHYDEEGRFIGLRGRTLVKEDGDRYGKYRPAVINNTMYNHPLGFNLYGLDKSKENIRKIQKAFVFEGEKSVLLYASYFGLENNISVATCGSSFSTVQFELLLKYGAKEIIIAYDKQFLEKGDKEFLHLVKNLKAINKKYGGYATISFLFDKKDLLGYKNSPIDCGRDTFLQLFRERIIL